MNRIFCFIFHSRAVFSGLTSFRGTSMQVSDILKVKGNAPLYTTQPETPLRAAISAMAEHDIGSLVVLKYGKLTGMLTFREIIAALRGKSGNFWAVAGRGGIDRYPANWTPERRCDEVPLIMLKR